MNVDDYFWKTKKRPPKKKPRTKPLPNHGADVQAERQAQANIRAGATQTPQLNQSIVNVVNWDDVPGVMAGPAGQQTTLNTISRNKTQIKKLLGIP